MAWKEAFLRQARSDLSAFGATVSLDKCHRLHNLQMAGEKVAKAFSLEAAANLRPSFSHYGFHRWLRTISFSTREARSLGFKSDADFRMGLPALRDTAQAIEHLNPKIANDRANGQITYSTWAGVGVNAEYPWPQGKDVVVPGAYPFAEPGLSDTRVIRLARFLDKVVARELGLDPLYG
jgi:hypothetical protein